MTERVTTACAPRESDLISTRSGADRGTGSDRKFPPLRHCGGRLAVDLESERSDVERQSVEYAFNRDPTLKARLVEAHQWLVILCARRMQRRREPLEDLIQVSNVGLLQALDRFDPAYGVTFRTYASATLDGVLRHHYRTTWRLRIPRRMQELHVRVGRATETLSVELQRAPSVAEVACSIGASSDEVREALDAGANFWPLSLSHVADCDRANSIGIPSAVDDAEVVERRVDVMALLSRLPELERKVMYMSFFEDRTQTEIGAIVGLSQVAVSRLIRKAVLCLRDYGNDNSTASGA